MEDENKNEEEYEDLRLAFLLFDKTALFRENIVALRELPAPLQRVSSSTVADLSLVSIPVGDSICKVSDCPLKQQ